MLNKLHIAKCSIEVVSDDTYTMPVDVLQVQPDFDVEQWEVATGDIAQAIGDTRLFFTLQYGFFEPYLGETAIGLAALIKKFMDLETVNLIPDAAQAATKFEVYFRFGDFGTLISTNQGTVSRSAMIPLMTKSRLTSTELQFFNFIN